MSMAAMNPFFWRIKDEKSSHYRLFQEKQQLFRV